MASAVFGRALVIIPTRNRAGLAIRAIQSVRDQAADAVDLLVSDNSTSTDEARELESYCRAQGDARLEYARPPAPLPMAAHWDWAIRRALTRHDISHFIYLTDRMLFRPGCLGELLGLASRHADAVVTYNHDRVVDFPGPVRLEQSPWTGRSFRIDSAWLLALSARSVFHACLPRMLNACVPRAVLHAVAARFGGVFDSIAPDFNFCYRCLHVVDSVLYYDRSLLLHYALDRSNGASIARGEVSRDCADFLANLGARGLNFAAPIPDFRTLCNTIIHEYCAVRHETGSARFPAVDHGRYLEQVAREVKQMASGATKREMRVLLAASGFVPPSAGRRLAEAVRKILSRRSLRLMRWPLGHPRTRPFWSLLGARFGVQPPGDQRFCFATTEEAMDYARRFPRRRQRDTSHLCFLGPGVTELGPASPARGGWPYRPAARGRCLTRS
jgi:glycosyltransferase involved in cell wall biosynthesis